MRMSSPSAQMVVCATQMSGTNNTLDASGRYYMHGKTLYVSIKLARKRREIVDETGPRLGKGATIQLLRDGAVCGFFDLDK